MTRGRAFALRVMVQAWHTAAMTPAPRLPRTFWFAVLLALAGVVWTGLVVRDVHLSRDALELRVRLLRTTQVVQRQVVDLPDKGDPRLAAQLDKLVRRIAQHPAGARPLPETAGLKRAAQAARTGNRAIAGDAVDAYIRQLRRQTGQVSAAMADHWQAMYAVCVAAFALVALALVMWVLAWRGQQTAAVATARLRVALQELEAARVSAEQESEQKSAYLASMSHEMRTPLTGIMGMAEAAARDTQSAEQRSRLQTMLAASQGLLEIIARVLDHAAIEAGKFDLQPTATAPADVVEATLAAVQGDATKSGVRLDVHVDAGVPRWLMLDGGRLRQVLVNFTGNAVKFSGQGTVVLRVSWESGRLLASVLDEGPGLPPGGAEGLFQPFVRGDPSSTRRVGGTGLGLSISRAIAEAMGGRVWAEARQGGGSVFSVEVPAPPAEAPSPVVQVATTSVERTASVLVVDDNDINRMVVAALLANDPVRIHAVPSAADALDVLGGASQAGQGPVDVVLMDCEMPHMDGWEATRTIRARTDRAASTPIVAMTAHTDADTRRRCAAAGMDDFVSKPVTRDELMNIIGRWMGARSTKRPRPAGPSSNLNGHDAHRTGLIPDSVELA